MCLFHQCHEIPIGSVQELLQKLLHAEMVIQERARRSGMGEKFPKKERQNETVSSKFNKVSQDKSNSSVPTKPKNQYEMSVKGVKCYRCQRRGYIAKNCTKSKSKSSFTVGVDCPETTESSSVDQVDELWLHTIVTDTDTQVVAAMKAQLTE